MKLNSLQLTVLATEGSEVMASRDSRPRAMMPTDRYSSILHTSSFTQESSTPSFTWNTHTHKMSYFQMSPLFLMLNRTSIRIVSDWAKPFQYSFFTASTRRSATNSCFHCGSLRFDWSCHDLDKSNTRAFALHIQALGNYKFLPGMTVFILHWRVNNHLLGNVRKC